jgi:pimeloyl-ACP methyl ester carboxylesterase
MLDGRSWILAIVMLCNTPDSHTVAQAAPAAATVQVNGSRLYYEMLGQGDPLVLISGGGSLDRRMWDDQFQHFARSYQVIRYDVRGLGNSGIPRKPYSPSEDLYRLLELMNISSAHIVGLSLGARLAIDFTLEHPDRVRTLIAASPGISGYSDDNQLIESLQTLATVAREDGIEEALMIVLSNPYLPQQKAVKERMRQILLDNPQVFYLGFPTVTLMKSLDPPALGRLSEIGIPTLVIAGSEDHESIRNIADSLVQQIPTARKVLIAGAHHMVNMEKPVEFNQAVLDFLSDPTDSPDNH